MAVRTASAIVTAVLAAACGAASTPAPASPTATSRTASERPPVAAPVAAPAPPPAPPPAPAIDRPAPSQDEILAAIQKAMTELRPAAQQCWAAAATVRFDVEGELALQIDIAAGGAQVTAVRDTAHNAALTACVVGLLAAYRWAPPLHGQSIQLPFKFRAPDGQSTIDRAMVAWNGQGSGARRISVAVLLDEDSTGNAAGSMFELAIAAGGTTGLRTADRAELWYFLAAGEVRSASRASTPVAAGDMMYVPRGGARELAATAGDLHAVLVVVPGGREGAARGGALPMRELDPAAAPHIPPPIVLPAAGAKPFGPATIFADASTIHDRALAASILRLAAGGTVAEHVHAGETELLYVLAGSGTMTVNGVALAVTPSSVIQIPAGARHAFTATTAVRAVQIYTPGGPEQRFKAHP